MATLQYYRVTTMDRAAKNCVKTSLKLANSVMATTGIAILMYSAWITVVCLRDYQKYPFPWFLWACIVSGIMFNFIACVGHVGADTRSNLLLSLYVVFMFLLIVVESLITADVCLNDNWYKDFPKDHTKRFKDFVHFVDDNSDSFRCLALLIAFSQVTSFFLAMVLRSMRPNPPAPQYIEDEEAKLPFLDHQIQPPLLPYAVGHPDPHYYPPGPPPPPYTYGYGYASNVTGNEKGEYVDATLQAAPKGG